MKSWTHSDHDMIAELDEHLTFYRWNKEDFLRIKGVDQPNHRHYPLFKLAEGNLTKIRRAVNGTLTPLQAASEYELMRTLPPNNELVISTYIVEEPSIMVFDDMPTSRYMEVDDQGFAKDFNYKDKSYHPSDIPIKSLDKVQVVRIHSPYSVSANPYYMDEGLINVDIQFGYNDSAQVREKWIQAVKETVSKYGIETKQDGFKLLFKHGDRWVKFESCEQARGVLAGYINIDSAYNKAYDFYKPDVEKDVRNQYAYGLKQANQNIDNSLVDEIIDRLGELLNIPVEYRPYKGKELANWRQMEKLHADTNWIKEAVRNDANWFWQEPVDGFEHEFDLLEKPSSNIFKFEIEHSGLEFHYQPALIPEEIEKGKQRPPNVVGSYAVYHPTKMHDNYMTGKFCHIYRPIAKDAKGLTQFCDINIDNDVLTITVPKEYLASAKYPVTVDPTIGYTTVGASTYQIVGSSTTPAYVALVNISASATKYNFMSAFIQLGVTGSTQIGSVTYGLYVNGLNTRSDYSAGYHTATGVANPYQWFYQAMQLTPTLSAIGFDLGVFVKLNQNSGYSSISIAADTVTNAGGANTSATYSNPPPNTQPTLTTVSDKFSIFLSNNVKPVQMLPGMHVG